MPETVVHFQIRMPPVLHEQLASWAKEDKASLNALIVGILEKAIEQHEAKAAPRNEPRPLAPSLIGRPGHPTPRPLSTVGSPSDAVVASDSVGLAARTALESAGPRRYPRQDRFPDSSIGRASGC